ncbi:hypothetical protein [Teichococcus vastitatis]|jgi:hypothetical protein|uniref:Uncharacterized protein n=1 Tax=Teichococcus vastitatis TaxID=2307076 RepID=A0ABS9W837_9PROT|nr:hypothetical protein [Pseudoroseomonas vastitatis]MCI0755402.1 hypothetical protein [Pseudoroseomonas vastitatis]
MLYNFFLMLVSSFILEPAQAEFDARLARLGAPPAVVREVSTCVSAAHPVLARTYSENPVHGIATAIRIWTGMASYEAVLQAEVPECKPALDAARPYIGPDAG